MIDCACLRYFRVEAWLCAAAFVYSIDQEWDQQKRELDEGVRGAALLRDGHKES